MILLEHGTNDLTRGRNEPAVSLYCYDGDNMDVDTCVVYTTLPPDESTHDSSETWVRNAMK